MTAEKIAVRPTALPDELLEKLQRFREGKYTNLVTVFHVVALFGDAASGLGTFVGVAGDGENGAYEYFFVSPHTVQVSEKGYGDDAIALKAALNHYAV